jgi:hypothetical protein
LADQGDYDMSIELAWQAVPQDVEMLAGAFDSISLKQMDAVALLNRIDTKFVLSSQQLRSALAALQADYWMLSIDGQRLSHYRTLYFDTPDFELYHAHVNGQAERYKVRSREYADSHLSFLEVKHKTRKDRTIKERIPTSQPVMQMTPGVRNWLDGVFPLDGGALEPKLWNTFRRITLVSKRDCERVTLDVDLTFHTADQVVTLDGIAIAEVKTDAGNRSSPFLARMRDQRIHQRGFSKYPIGICMLCERVKKNALKPKMLWIEKMMRGAANHE